MLHFWSLQDNSTVEKVNTKSLESNIVQIILLISVKKVNS